MRIFTLFLSLGLLPAATAAIATEAAPRQSIMGQAAVTMAAMPPTDPAQAPKPGSRAAAAPRSSPAAGADNGWIMPVPTPYGPILQQQALPPPYRDYQMSRILSPEERKRWMHLALPMMGHMMKMDAREAMNHFAIKYKAKPGLKFDDVVESMMLRANRQNLKFVGSNLLWKDFRSVLGDQAAPRVEVFSFCDIAVGLELLKIIPEFAVFLPCRITVMEDADKNIWVLTLDWDITWLDQAGTQTGITPELRQSAIIIRDKLDNVMRAGANGEL